MWIEPPATISAPEPTEPKIVTSPSANTTDCPERTGLSSSSEPGLAFSATGLEVVGISAQSRPPLSSGGKSSVSCEPSAPSMPSTRMSRSPRLPISWRIPPLLKDKAERSSITGLPVKNAGDRDSVASTSASQSITGGCGAST